MMNYSSRPPEEPAVHAQDLTVVRGSRTVLRGLGFTVPAAASPASSAPPAAASPR